MNARAILQRYLRQLEEGGEGEVFLDALDATEVRALLGVAEGVGRGPVHSARSPRPDRPDRRADTGHHQEGYPSGHPPGHSPSHSPSHSSGQPSSHSSGQPSSHSSGGATAERGAPGGLLEALARHAPGVISMGGRGSAQTPKRAAEPVREPGALQVLGERVAHCTDCGLHEGRQNVVFGEGSPSAELVVVGEAPGSEEDRTGRPFVGRAGKLLDLLLLSAGFERDEVYICNVLKCRPPGNRDPQPAEVEACSLHLREQLDAIRPRILLAVGKFAAQRLTGREENIGALRGALHSYQGIPLVVTYHPAFLLRSQQWTRAAWRDFQLVRETLERARLES